MMAAKINGKPGRIGRASPMRPIAKEMTPKSILKVLFIMLGVF